MKSSILRLLSLSLLLGTVAFAQSSGRSFEVASIKPSAPMTMGRIMIGMGTDAGILRYTNVSLKDCIKVAYKVKDFQVEGPDWLEGTRYDITAKLPDGATEKDVPELLQQLLAERFKLTLHRETKDHPIYALVQGKDGAKLKPAEVQTEVAGGGEANASAAGKAVRRDNLMFRMDPSGLHLQTLATTVAGLADALSRFTDRPIVDMTNIEGQYAFDMAFAPETIKGIRMKGPMMAGGDHATPPAGADAPAEQGPSIFDAVQRYGLKLESRKAPMEILTIDHIEKTPTEN